MKTIFFKKLFLFLLPALILFAPPLLVLLRTGELQSIDSLVEEQNSENPDLRVGLAYSEPNPYYKVLGFLKKKNDIMILGNSQVLTFRTDYLGNNGKTAYNAGVAAKQVYQLMPYLKAIPKDRLPKVIIFGMGQNFYFEPREIISKSAFPVEGTPQLQRVFRTFFTHWKKVYTDYFAGKFSTKEIFDSAPYKNYRGIQGRTLLAGYRADGSFDFGRTEIENSKTKPEALNQFIAKAATRIGHFKFTDGISTNAVNELRKVLAFCQNYGIKVVIYVPPYTQVAYTKMTAMPEFKSFLDIPKIAETLGNEFGFEVHNYVNVTSIGVDDSEFIDDNHLTDGGHAKLAAHLIQQSPTLRALTAEETALSVH